MGEETVVINVEDTTTQEVEKPPVRVDMGELDRWKKEAMESRAEAQIANSRLQEERQLREQAQEQARTFSTAYSEKEYEGLVNQITSQMDKLESLRAELKSAQEDGDFDKSSRLMIEVSSATSAITNMQQNKSVMDSNRERMAKQQPQPQRQQSRIDWNRPWTQEESNAAMSGYTPRTAAWMRENPRFFTDVGFRNQVSGAHAVAVGRGLQPDTPEYFREVEKIVGIGGEQTQAQPDEAHHSEPHRQQQEPYRPPVSAAAPPSRSVPSSNPGASSNSVTLTAEEREMSRFLFPDEKDPERKYAENKLAAIREGRKF